MASVASCCAATLGRPDLRGHPPALRTRVRRVWIARSASAVITGALCEHRPRPLVAPVGLVDAPGDYPGADCPRPSRQNGSHEQFHSVLKADTARPPAAHARAQQRRFDRFCAEYNHERPHEALQDAVPASCYQPSPRPWPRQLPALEYPGHLEVRRVSTSVRSRGAAPCCLSAKRSPTRTLPLKKSTMASGRSALPPWSSVATTNVTAAFNRWHRYGGALAGCAGSRLT